MLAREPQGEQPLLDRCTRRYALLEELLGALAENGVDPKAMREALDQIDADPSRYRRLDTALADALASDRSILRALDLVLARSFLPATLRAFLASRRAELKLSGPLPRRAGSPERPATAATLTGPTLEPAAPATCRPRISQLSAQVWRTTDATCRPRGSVSVTKGRAALP
jgi:hypothetical protein